MTNAIAKQLEDASEAQAMRVEEQIRANDMVKQSIKHAVLDFVDLVVSELDARNQALTALASSIRDGTPLLPHVTQFVVVNADAVVEGQQEAA